MAKSSSDTAPKSRSTQKSVSTEKTKRKRELDRIAQRTCRERTKNRISFLEEKVRSLEARDHNGQSSSLMVMQEKLLKDNAELKAAMMKIRLIADSILNTPDSNVCQNCRNSASGSDSTRSPEEPIDDVEQRRGSNNCLDAFPELRHHKIYEEPELDLQPALELSDVVLPSQDIDLGNMPLHDIAIDAENFDDEPLVLDTAISYDPFLETDLSLIPGSAAFDAAAMAPWQNMSFDWNIPMHGNSGVLKHEEMWLYCDGTFIRGLEMTRTEKSVRYERLDNAVPIRAILWGWDTIDEKTRNHPAWLALRDVDEKIFGNWKSRAQKIALMYVCSLVMQYRVDPTPENLERVPSWLRPRPSQERLQHPLVIDFLIWPGLRDFLVFNHLLYNQTGEFSERFTEDFNFNWPFPESSIFQFDPICSQFTFSSLFLEYVFDLSNWTMEPRFFERYKELAHDIPMNMRRTGGPAVGPGWTGGFKNGEFGVDSGMGLVTEMVV